ncbi:helix-turn-helix domain-containing protein [Marinomonas sp. IMCC 4694]|uniref:helix-turn-helix domain-containing protein n=1 Tax=Marinomonas sp. IMCC 4694 TaxID=2605432 RepID=UPI0011E840C9|nr:AraC family transcriptional regulator [Marinomonas sp. IMCC 4694]TYL48223.1 AraC family transcriptional regulator [Marinomonas sp. IMCC 4694]
MQIHMRNVYDGRGEVKKAIQPWLSGHSQRLDLLPGLQLLKQHLHSKSDVSVCEEAPSSLYFSFVGTGPIHSANDAQSLQIAYHPRRLNGSFDLPKGYQQSTLQICIRPSLLATVLGETEAQLVQHLIKMVETLSNPRGIIELTLTKKSLQLLGSVVSHKGHTISLTGHLYALLFTLIEQLQQLNHLAQCDDCQRKVFHAQNLLEIPINGALNIKQLAQKVGLNSDTLAIGFAFVVGQSIEDYGTERRIKFAAAQLRQNPMAKPRILAESGFSEDEFEAAFIEHYGVSSQQYKHIH